MLDPLISSRPSAFLPSGTIPGKRVESLSPAEVQSSSAKPVPKPAVTSVSAPPSADEALAIARTLVDPKQADALKGCFTTLNEALNFSAKESGTEMIQSVGLADGSTAYLVKNMAPNETPMPLVGFEPSLILVADEKKLNRNTPDGLRSETAVELHVLAGTELDGLAPGPVFELARAAVLNQTSGLTTRDLGNRDRMDVMQGNFVNLMEQLILCKLQLEERLDTPETNPQAQEQIRSQIEEAKQLLDILTMRMQIMPPDDKTLIPGTSESVGNLRGQPQKALAPLQAQLREGRAAGKDVRLLDGALDEGTKLIGQSREAALKTQIRLGALVEIDQAIEQTRTKISDLLKQIGVEESKLSQPGVDLMSVHKKMRTLNGQLESSRVELIAKIEGARKTFCANAGHEKHALKAGAMAAVELIDCQLSKLMKAKELAPVAMAAMIAEIQQDYRQSEMLEYCRQAGDRFDGITPAEAKTVASILPKANQYLKAAANATQELQTLKAGVIHEAKISVAYADAPFWEHLKGDGRNIAHEMARLGEIRMELLLKPSDHSYEAKFDEQLDRVEKRLVQTLNNLKNVFAKSGVPDFEARPELKALEGLVIYSRQLRSHDSRAGATAREVFSKIGHIPDALLNAEIREIATPLLALPEMLGYPQAIIKSGLSQEDAQLAAREMAQKDANHVYAVVSDNGLNQVVRFDLDQQNQLTKIADSFGSSLVLIAQGNEVTGLSAMSQTIRLSPLFTRAGWNLLPAENMPSVSAVPNPTALLGNVSKGIFEEVTGKTLPLVDVSTYTVDSLSSNPQYQAVMKQVSDATLTALATQFTQRAKEYSDMAGNPSKLFNFLMEMGHQAVFDANGNRRSEKEIDVARNELAGRLRDLFDMSRFMEPSIPDYETLAYEVVGAQRHDPELKAQSQNAVIDRLKDLGQALSGRAEGLEKQAKHFEKVRDNAGQKLSVEDALSLGTLDGLMNADLGAKMVNRQDFVFKLLKDYSPLRAQVFSRLGLNLPTNSFAAEKADTLRNKVGPEHFKTPADMFVAFGAADSTEPTLGGMLGDLIKGVLIVPALVESWHDFQDASAAGAAGAATTAEVDLKQMEFGNAKISFVINIASLGGGKIIGPAAEAFSALGGDALKQAATQDLLGYFIGHYGLDITTSAMDTALTKKPEEFFESWISALAMNVATGKIRDFAGQSLAWMKKPSEKWEFKLHEDMTTLTLSNGKESVELHFEKNPVDQSTQVRLRRADGTLSEPLRFQTVNDVPNKETMQRLKSEFVGNKGQVQPTGADNPSTASATVSGMPQTSVERQAHPIRPEPVMATETGGPPKVPPIDLPNEEGGPFGGKPEQTPNPSAESGETPSLPANSPRWPNIASEGASRFEVLETLRDIETQLKLLPPEQAKIGLNAITKLRSQLAESDLSHTSHAKIVKAGAELAQTLQTPGGKSGFARLKLEIALRGASSQMEIASSHSKTTLQGPERMPPEIATPAEKALMAEQSTHSRLEGPEPYLKSLPQEKIAMMRNKAMARQPMTDDEVKLLILDVVSNVRTGLKLMDPSQDFSPKKLEGKCGVAREAVVARLKELGIEASFIKRHQAINVFSLSEITVEPSGYISRSGDDWNHAFVVVNMPNGKAYLIDPTFRQFSQDLRPNRAPGSVMIDTAAGVKVADQLLRYGFFELTDEAEDIFAKSFMNRAGKTADYQPGTLKSRDTASDGEETIVVPSTSKLMENTRWKE